MDGAQLVRQPLIAHLLELRKRLLWSVLIFLAAAGASYLGREVLVRLIQAPLHQTLYYTTPAGGLEFIMKVCTLVGLAAAIPALVYHLIKFVEPATTVRLTRAQALSVIIFSFILLCAGVSFGYKVILPLALHFFGEFGGAQIKPLISATDYLSFVLGCLVTFALMFQLPILMLFINRIHPLDPGQLMKYQKHVIIGSLGLALILPFTYDPLTQFAMAVPIIVLYEISIILIWLVNRRKPQPAAAKSAPAPAPILPPAAVIAQNAPARRRATPKVVVSSHVLDLRQPH